MSAVRPASSLALPMSASPMPMSALPMSSQASKLSLSKFSFAGAADVFDVDAGVERCGHNIFGESLRFKKRANLMPITLDLIFIGLAMKRRE